MTTTRHTFDRVAAHGTPPVAAHPDIACRGEDPEIFYPARGCSADRARRICNLCDHRDECLTWALDTGQAFGIWGGTSPEERFQLIKARTSRRTA